ncbi:MAG: VanW family protein [Flammeovirgaceae bacterium]
MTNKLMWKSTINKPIQRSKLRKVLGKRYYIAKRWWKWQKERHSFATHQQQEALPYRVIEHQSTLLRKLKDVDMWMQHNKVENLKLAIQPLTGLIIQPNETFSLWYLVGNPSKRRGFKLGMVLEQGKVTSGYGGGLCQLANLLFWMVIHSPLTIKERWRHSFDVFPDVNRTIPFGCGATIAYNYIDLQVKNETDQAFQLKLWLSDEKLHGQLLSASPLSHAYQVYEAEHRIVGETWGGYTRHNLIHRKVTHLETGELIEDVPLVENHAIMMYNPLLSA